MGNPKRSSVVARAFLWRAQLATCTIVECKRQTLAFDLHDALSTFEWPHWGPQNAYMLDIPRWVFRPGCSTVSGQ